MSNELTKLKFPQSDFSDYDFPEKNIFAPLSLVNILIGPNNSGKSRFLRNLFNCNEMDYVTNLWDNTAFIELLKNLNPCFQSIFQGSVEIISEMNKNDLEKFMKGDEFIPYNNSIYANMVEFFGNCRNSSGAISTIESFRVTKTEEIDEMHMNMRQFGNDSLKRLEAIKFDPNFINSKKIYIPVLRGMRPLEDKLHDLYLNRTKNDYFTINGSVNLKGEIFTGLELYRILEEKILGEPDDRKIIKNYEEFLSKTFFQSEQVTLIPKKGTDTVHVKIGNEKQFPIYNLGDGLQQLIIITFNIFIRQERCLFFIEEPDLYMHPGFQRLLIEMFIKHDQHQYFLTTHSNHLLDLTLDYNRISIFQFKKELNNNDNNIFIIKHVASKENNILRELGVLNSSVFISNCTIWIEGITDRLYIRTYLKKYLEVLKEKDNEKYEILSKFMEDIHYSFVEYQGSNLTHWCFDKDQSDNKRIAAKSLCGNSILLADGDIVNKGNKREVYEKMLKERFIIYDCKEIENLIPEKVLKIIIKDKFKENNSALETIKYSKYSKSMKGLGTYLDKKLGKKSDKKCFAAESGTIKNKIDFCMKAVDYMENNITDWNLPEPIELICEKIYDHIKKSNE